MTGISFDDIQLDPSVSRGARGGAQMSTTIFEAASGHEQRNRNWANRRGRWDISYGLKTDAQCQYLLNFWHARHGRAYGFRMKDWSDFRVPLWRNTPGDVDTVPTMHTTDGATASFQIVKVYGDAARSYTRDIVKVVSGSDQVWDNGSPLTRVTDYTIDYATGIITLSGAITATSGHAITVACEFDVPVRFDTDEQPITIDDHGIYSWSGIPLREIRDIT